jgi:hypothetical protein
MRWSVKVQVLTHYDSVETVNVSDLRRLIASGEVLAFHRADGWVKVGTEPIRGDGGREYDGPERRNIIQKPLTEEQKRAGHHCVIAASGPKPKW